MSTPKMVKVKTKDQIIRAKFIWLTLSGIISVALAYLFVALLLFLLQSINPDYNVYYKHFWLFSYDHGQKFRFYSGEKPSSYAKIGKAITSDAPNSRGIGVTGDSIGTFEDKDTIENFASSGGYENFMKVTSEKNSFSLVQEAVLKLQDEQLLKSVKVITPLFEERLHILYRKDLIPARYSSKSNLQLSANTETWILNSFFRSVRNVEVGEVGSCTRIIAGDVMDLIENQIRHNAIGKNIPHFILKGDPLSFVYSGMKGYSKHSSKDTIDLVFYLGLDPTNEMKDILASGKYELMSVSPSFLNLLNTEFKMNLQVANFQKKYDNQEGTNTVGTFIF